ncbi:neprilysin-11 [Anabrus simplex]|uniref:neprilysin-11 n=1 Tax=Anabrus simplex TaxID=316456 RepID=UPI0034DD251F
MRYKVSETSSMREMPARRDSHPESHLVGRKTSRLVVGIALLSTVVIFLVATVGVLVTLHLNSETQRAPIKERYMKSICLSEECVLSASRIIQSLDRDVDPCHDFYQFACGGWIRQNPVPESQSSWDQFRALRGELLLQIRELLEEGGSPEDIKPIQQARMLYRTCMDTERLEALSVQPMLEVMEKLDIPADGTQVHQDPINWVRLLARTHRSLGLNVLFGFWVSQDVRNTSRNLMVVDQIQPGISEKYLLDPERFAPELKEYRLYIRDMVHVYRRHLNAGDGNTDDEEDVLADKFSDDILDFSTKLAKIMTTAEERRDARRLLHELPVTELQRLSDVPEPGPIPPMNWTEFLETVMEDTNVTLNYSTDIVVVMDSAYFQKLAALLSTTEPAILDRYIWWNIFSTLAPLTLQEFRDLAFRFSQRVFGLTQKMARWQGCTGNVNANFGMAVSYLYVQKHFNNESRSKALDMVGDIQNAFTQIVGELDWMDAATKELTLDKAHAMRPFIGFPGWLLNPGQLEHHYEQANVVEGQLFETYLRLSDATMKKTLEDLRRSPDRDRWVTPATAINAFYSPVLNSVTFPAGILQPPFYGLGLESLNYGAIGAIMGHELTHGFDDQGRRYDKYGNLKQWWTEATLVEYERRMQCIVEQYGRYEVPQIGENFTVNGINTVGENIADNGGLREAMRAYRKFRARNVDAEQQLPGLSAYTPEQLFFLGFAHMWCGNSTRGALRSRVVEGVHSPNRFRVIGTLSNSVDFAEAWSCPKNSPMNPEHKCVLW